MRRAALVAALVFASGPTAAAAQSRAAGAVLRFTGSDSAPVPGVRVVLHRVGRERQGPIDSVLTDRRGRFRFTFLSDTTSLFLLTARFAGVQYFSEPLGTNPATPDTALLIAVFDTTSTQAVRLDARHVVIAAPADNGTRSVVELLSITNPGRATRVAADAANGVWSMRLPRGAFGFAAGEGDLSAGAVERRGDSVVVVSPIAPGERQLAIEYLLPPGIDELAIPFDEAAALVNILLEEKKARVRQASLEPADTAAVIQGRQFTRWSGSMSGGAVLAVDFPRRGPPGAGLLAALVAATGLALTAGTALALRRRPAVAVLPARPEAIADAIVRLDDRYATRRDMLEPSERQEYERERAALKAELHDALARGRTAT